MGLEQDIYIRLAWSAAPVLELEGVLAGLVGAGEQIPQAAPLHEVHGQYGVPLRSQPRSQFSLLPYSLQCMPRVSAPQDLREHQDHNTNL